MIYCTVGTTSSGKSTWAKKTQIPIISDDALREMLYGTYKYVQKDEWWLKGIALQMALSVEEEKGDCIIDSASWFLREEDRKIEDLLPQIRWVIFPIPTEKEVKERRKNDKRGISLDTWVEVYKQHKEYLDYNQLTENNSFEVSKDELC